MTAYNERECVNCAHLNANTLKPDCPCHECCAAGGKQNWVRKS